MTTPTGTTPPASTPPATPPATPPSGTTTPSAPPATPPSSTPPANPDQKVLAPRVVPDTYDLKPPKDGHFSDPHITRVAAFAKANKLTQEEAAAVLEFAHSEVATVRNGASAAWDKQVDDWETAAKNDKEIGGANFEKSSKAAGALVAKFGDQELIDGLAAGWGNYPPLIRFLSKVAAHFDADELVPPSPGSGGGGKEKSAAEVLYGSTTPSS